MLASHSLKAKQLLLPGVNAERRRRLCVVSASSAFSRVSPPEPLPVACAAGIIHAAEEKDWKTAYSYFFEAFEGYDSIDSPRAITALKYMLLCKIVLNL